MDNQGWVKLHRKSLASSVWDKPNVWRVWCWCLMKANHKEKKFPFNGGDIIIKKGEFITGINKACKETKLTCQKYRTSLDYLKNSSRITTKTTNQFTIISVIKWEMYQNINIQNNKQITNEQQTDNKRITTNKNDNNDNNDKKNIEVSKLSEKDMEMVDLLISLIKQNSPDWQFKGNKNTWAEHIEKLHRIDNISYDNIEAMIMWVQQDRFWSANILSTSKLREKFNGLIPKAVASVRGKGKRIIGLEKLLKN